MINSEHISTQGHVRPANEMKNYTKTSVGNRLNNNFLNINE